ncbi:MAG: phosphate acyltransferase PlsX [Oscillospiraceae bacterium]|jgi:glycerol-3-phosphate acyltransferase PlsX|nr:phosphate acyltransferase PlsX [Oscillospiraceae bacterium]
MKIAVDGFGGDKAPDEALKGCVWAVKEFGAKIVVTGDEKTLKSRFSKLGLSRENIEIAHADGVIEIGDDPLEIRTVKANTSMGVAFGLVRKGEAEAFVSAGSTAALMVGGSMVIGRIKGVKRPALAPIMPSVTGNYILLDGGANVECRPEMILQFGIMGGVYAEKIMGIERPRVGLLNVGAEEEKGRELERGAYALLKASSLNFIGNAEARDVPLGVCDVIVSDGFTGNIYLKTVEGMGAFMKKSLKDLFGKNAATKAGYLLAKGGVRDMAAKTDYREIGGSPLLGTVKPVIKAHGSSDAKAFKNAIKQAKEFSDARAINLMEKSLGAKERS